MSDIQRYCLDESEMMDSDRGEYVKYSEHLAEVERLEAENRRLKGVKIYISLSDRLPKKDGHYLVKDSQGHEMLNYYNVKKNEWRYVDGHKCKVVCWVEKEASK